MGLEQLFWSAYYKKDASLLVQDISFEARKHMKVVEADVLKLQKVQLAISEGVKVLNHTLCQDCNRKLHHYISPSHQSITRQKDKQNAKRLPKEYQNVIKELELVLIQKEKLINGGKDGEKYCTTDEWHEQEIADLNAQHEREIKELRMQLEKHETQCTEHQKIIASFDIKIATKDRTIENNETDIAALRLRITKETGEAKRRNQELAETHETQCTEHKNIIASYDVRIATKDRTIEYKEKDIAALRLRIARQEDDIKIQDKSITELCQRNLQEKSTKREPKPETEKKQSAWNFFSGGTQKEEQNTVRLENVKLRSDLQRALQEKEQVEKTLLEKKNEQTRARSQMEKLHDEKRNLIADLRAVKGELDPLRIENAKLHSDIQNTLQDGEQKRTDLKGKQDELIRALSQIDKLYNERTNLIADLQTKAEELQRQKEELDDSHQENQQIRHDLNEQGEELQALRGQLEENIHPSKKSIVMGLHCNRSGLGKPLVDMVIKELTSGVQDRLDRNNINLTIQFSQTPSEVTSWLKVVLCLNMSRVGTNILDTLKGMKGDRDVFVLVLHHTNKDNLSSLTPTSHRVTGSELRQLGGILDMAFSSDSGLYECDVNSNAIDKIASVLRKYIVI